ncbi:hypothetical protein B0H13DRAFT_1858173 [Mycena leptocephala]|nr:hypothetical protein B0H13DRAFT_1858173 [Mycena leptocephala]
MHCAISLKNGGCSTAPAFITFDEANWQLPPTLLFHKAVDRCRGCRARSRIIVPLHGISLWVREPRFSKRTKWAEMPKGKALEVVESEVPRNASGTYCREKMKTEDDSDESWEQVMNLRPVAAGAELPGTATRNRGLKTEAFAFKRQPTGKATYNELIHQFNLRVLKDVDVERWGLNRPDWINTSSARRRGKTERLHIQKGGSNETAATRRTGAWLVLRDLNDLATRNCPYDLVVAGSTKARELFAHPDRLAVSIGTLTPGSTVLSWDACFTGKIREALLLSGSKALARGLLIDEDAAASEYNGPKVKS